VVKYFMNFIFDEEKNQKLLQQRNVTFEQAIEIIANGGVLFDFKHPKPEQYPNQRIETYIKCCV